MTEVNMREDVKNLLQVILKDCQQYTSDCFIDGSCVVASNKALPVYRNISTKYRTDALAVLLSGKGITIRLQVVNKDILRTLVSHQFPPSGSN